MTAVIASASSSVFSMIDSIVGDLLDDLRKWRPDPAEWCVELAVTPHLLRVFLAAA
ncbi:hypothetical protein IAE22_31885 [Bacillus sp. S34]|nr:hypothetical protein [Bacillus sp. S34]